MEIRFLTQDEVTSEWNDMAGEWDDRAWAYAGAFYRMLQENQAMLPFHTTRIVDFGCGTGALTELLRRSDHNADRTILCVDASPRMIEIVHDKIRTRDWGNVHGVTAVLARLSTEPEPVQQIMRDWRGTVGLIVTGSVLICIPPSDRAATMQQLGALLQPDGVLVHCDWPRTDAHHPYGMTETMATELYAMAGLHAQSMQVETWGWARGIELQVFVGVARKQA